MLVSVSVMVLTSSVAYTTSKLSPKGYTIMASSTIAVSMATNLLATLMIGYKLWFINISPNITNYCLFPSYHRGYQKTISNFGLEKQQSPVQKVLFLLVESGVIFFVLQVNSFCVFMHMSTTLLTD